MWESCRGSAGWLWKTLKAAFSKSLSLSVTSVPAPPSPVWLSKGCLNLVLQFCCDAFLLRTPQVQCHFDGSCGHGNVFKSPKWLISFSMCHIHLAIPRLPGTFWWGPTPAAAGTVLPWFGGTRRPNYWFQLHRLHSGKSALRTNYFSFVLSTCHSNCVHEQWLTCLGMPWNHCWLSLSLLFLLLIYSLFRKHRHLTEVPLGLSAGFWPSLLVKEPSFSSRAICLCWLLSRLPPHCIFNRSENGNTEFGEAGEQHGFLCIRKQ